MNSIKKVLTAANVFLICLCSIQILYAQRQAPLSNLTVLLNNYTQVIPLGDLGNRNIAYLSHSAVPALSSMGDMLEEYAAIQRFVLPVVPDGYGGLDEQLKYYNTLIVGLESTDLTDERLLQFLSTQSVGKQIILAVFGAGAPLSKLDFVHDPIVWNADLTTHTAQNAAMSIFGGLACTARLPQSFSARYATGAGFTTEQTRLEYTDASAVGIDAQALETAIDTIVEEAIRERATPGAVVLVAKGGKVIFNKAYGHHTYAGDVLTKVSDLFDMASVTKITATTPTIMRLVERGMVNLDSTMGYYLVQAQSTNKKDTKLRSVMLHEAGFIPFIPFYRELKPDDLSTDSSATYSVKVADSCYIRTGYYQNVMWPIMLNSKLNTPGEYIYSDISMYVMKEVAEHQTGIPIQDYVQQEFYGPLGMQTAGYLPRLRFPKERIVPTQDDQVFRKTLLQGYVHDEGAAMAGGIAGHAGLFATANDMAIYGQLLLNRGEYGGDRYFKSETVDLFTSQQSTVSRRGLGFDRAYPDTARHYPSKWASAATFGHTGYTGTCVWIDPEAQLIYVFLSNRVYPQVNDKLWDLGTRPRIQEAIYEAINMAK